MSFDVAADAYDRFMGGWSSRLAHGFADFAGVSPDQRVLDVGCGTGALTSELVARLGPGRVAAVDPSSAMAAAARDRFPGVDVREAAAESLPFGSETYDAVLAQLVVHFLTEPVAGLAEMARVARAEGVVAACVWDFAGGRGPLGPFWEAAAAIDARTPGEGHLPGTREGHLVALLAEAGLTDTESARLDVDRSFPSFETWWEPFTKGVGPAGAFVATLPPRGVEQLRERCRSMLPSGAFELRASAWAARGHPTPRRSSATADESPLA